MKIYICWEEQEYFTSFEDVLDYYEHYCDCTTFDDFLATRYRCETIFDFTEDERKSVIKDYKSVLIEEVKEWVKDYCEVVEIKAEFKEK